MKQQSIPILAIGVVLTGFAFSSEALAMRKIENTCNTRQLNTNFGSSCNDQMQDDIRQGHSYLHVLFCSGDAMLCCTVTKDNQITNCRKPAGSIQISPLHTGPSIPLQGTPLQTSPPQTVPGITQRGVEGEAKSGESVPVPEWVKEEVGKDQAREQKSE